MADDLIDLFGQLNAAPNNTDPVGDNGIRASNAMDLDVLDPNDWMPDQASVDYIKNLTRKYRGNPHARRVRITQTWIQAKSGELEPHQRDRLLAGAPIEDAFPDYDAGSDDDACLLPQKIGKGVALALQACIREHIAYLSKKPTAKAAFPNGVVTRDRIQHFLAHRYDADAPDHGCTAEACCPNLFDSSCSPWNVTFVDTVTADFISKVAEDWYGEHGLPPEALVEKHVSSRVLVSLRSMIKTTRRKAKLNTADKIAQAKRHDKYMERRRVKHKNRLRICDETPKYNKYLALLKAVGPEGNSDEETDDDAGVTPLPIKVYPLKWRSREYEKLLHSLDSVKEDRSTAALLHSGPIRSSSRQQRDHRRRVPTRSTANKVLSNTCPKGKPNQFYDHTYLQDARTQGFLPSLRIKSRYPHPLPPA